MQYSFALTQWAHDPLNQKAWKEIMEKHKLIQNPFEDIGGLFPFADALTWGMANINLSMNKARLMGWTGFVDTTEAIFQTFSEMNKLKMLPPPVVEKARPNV